MLMVSASQMELQHLGSMCGPLLLAEFHVTAHVHAPLGVSHNMLGRTTSVKLAMIAMNMHMSGLLMMCSGMAKTVWGREANPVPVSVPFNSPPWFCRQLPQATTDDIEVRICGDEFITSNEDTTVKVIEIYIC